MLITANWGVMCAVNLHLSIMLKHSTINSSQRQLEQAVAYSGYNLALVLITGFLLEKHPLHSTHSIPLWSGLDQKVILIEFPTSKLPITQSVAFRWGTTMTVVGVSWRRMLHRQFVRLFMRARECSICQSQSHLYNQVPVILKASRPINNSSTIQPHYHQTVLLVFRRYR